MKACPVQVRAVVVGAVVAQGWTWARAAGTYGVSLASAHVQPWASTAVTTDSRTSTGQACIGESLPHSQTS